MDEFNIYRLTNIEANQMANPMKRMALLLGFIKGDKVNTWVQYWSNWAVHEMNTG